MHSISINHLCIFSFKNLSVAADSLERQRKQRTM